MPVRALASTTNLTTGVPDEVSLRVEITGEGTVTVGEVRLSATGTVSVKRHQPFTVSLEPKSGYQVSDVRLNGKSVLASLKDGKLVIDALNLDDTLSVTFSKTSGSWNGSNPRTGDQQGTAAMIAALTATASLVLLQLLRKKNIYRQELTKNVRSKNFRGRAESIASQRKGRIRAAGSNLCR